MLTHFAAPRLATLRTFFKTETDRDLLGCYAWNQAVASGLFPLLGDFEVALRNRLHVALSRYHGGVDSFNWMLPRPNPAHLHNPAAPPTLPSKHKFSPKTRADLVSLKIKIESQKGPGYVATPDDIVAGLHFGFWEQLVKGLSHAAQPAGLQATILSAVFQHAPNLAAVPHGHADFRDRVAELLKRIREVRNRVGHHDALWGIPEFDEYGAVGFVPRRPRHTVKSLQKFCSRLTWFAGWMAPAVPKHMQESDHWWSFHALLNREALATYRREGGRVGTYQAVLDGTAGASRARNASTPRMPGHIVARVRARQFHY